MINVSIDSGRTLNWNQAQIVANSGKIIVRIDVIRDIVGVGCLMRWQFNEVDNDSSSRLKRMHIEIQAHSSRCLEGGGHNNLLRAGTR